jgi:flavorubredoxin
MPHRFPLMPVSTFVAEIASPGGVTFNQFLVLADEPIMFHTGLRKMFPLNFDALQGIITPERLRWIAYGHFEADECGAMNEWLAVAPQAQSARGQTGVVRLGSFCHFGRRGRPALTCRRSANARGNQR